MLLSKLGKNYRSQFKSILLESAQEGFIVMSANLRKKLFLNISYYTGVKQMRKLVLLLCFLF